MEGWQPIETARDTLPDTRSRLVYVPGVKCIYCVTWGPKGWEIFGGDFRATLQDATHWMPLPAPPVTP